MRLSVREGNGIQRAAPFLVSSPLLFFIYCSFGEHTRNMSRGIKCWASCASFLGIACLALFALRMARNYQEQHVVHTLVNQWQASEENIVFSEPKEEIYINNPESTSESLTTTASTSTSTQPIVNTSPVSSDDSIEVNSSSISKKENLLPFEGLSQIPFKPLPPVWSSWNVVNSSSSHAAFVMLAFDILFLHSLQQVKKFYLIRRNNSLLSVHITVQYIA